MPGSIDPTSQALGELSARVRGVENQLTTVQIDMRRITDYFHELREDLALIKSRTGEDREEARVQSTHSSGRQAAVAGGVVAGLVSIVPWIVSWLMPHK